MDRNLWEAARQFHGHSCGGLAVGLRVAEAAMLALGNSRDKDEEMVAVVENDSCAVDAIQVVTGCTAGKGNLIFKDYGKQVYTFALREGGKAVRIIVDMPKADVKRQELMALREKVDRGEASTKEIQLLQGKSADMVDFILDLPLDEVCRVETVDCRLPKKARIFTTLECSRCGEKVMEPRARLQGGKPVCLPCCEEYTRGWGNG